MISRNCITFIIVLGALISSSAQGQTPSSISKQFSDTWAAVDALDRTLPLNEGIQDLKKDKYVGIFYFLWLGAHGYDEHRQPLPDEGVQPKQISDTISPYDIEKLLVENPENPEYGPVKAFHHWGEPYFGYYLSNDEWVIMKHAQMLSDAQIDVIVFDVTNSLAYLPQVNTVCRVFARLQKKGWSVPKIAFLTNTKHVETTEKIYEGFYKKGRYKDLWFYWKGKPLFMGNKEGLGKEMEEFFNFRRSWAWTEGQEWFGGGKDKWPWIDHYPQNYGWHESPDQPEQIVVSTAQHPISNIGRSYHNGKQPAQDKLRTGDGLFFEEQWKRAHQVNPEFVFITGWNEWVAMRFNDGRAKQMMGEEVENGDTYFVDQYNAEFSRDIEPMKGGFGDNYYYQMISNIRKFKGTRPVPTNNGFYEIEIDGVFEDWKKVTSTYYDHQGDILVREYPGWGRIDSYSNNTGRNDIIQAKVAEDGTNYYFLLELANDLKSESWPQKLDLLIKANGNGYNWEGFTHKIGLKENSSSAVLKTYGKRDKWHEDLTLKHHVVGNMIEVALPKSSIRVDKAYFDFKWTDNFDVYDDIMKFYDHGDVAPNGRFTYRYILMSNKN
ncbi:MAG: glycoside hydrolase family 71/99 protein [Flagellimonas sp.]